MVDDQPRADWRINVGFAMFVASIGWPLLIPVFSIIGLPTTAITAFSGVMVVVAELLLIVAAAIVGKEGFAYIKKRVFVFLRSYGPQRDVSRARYNVGLVLFVTSITFGWAAPYFGHSLPAFETRMFLYAAAGDVLLLVSLFVLGGAFWDKLRALFQHNAYAIVSDNSATHPDSKE